MTWQQDRDHERSVMDYLQGDVFTSPGRALVWWLAQHPDDIQGAVDRVGQLTRLSAVSQGRGDPGAAGPQLVPKPGARPAEHRDLTATRDLLSELFPESQDNRDSFARELARTRRGVRPERLRSTHPPELRVDAARHGDGVLSRRPGAAGPAGRAAVPRRRRTDHCINAGPYRDRSERCPAAASTATGQRSRAVGQPVGCSGGTPDPPHTGPRRPTTPRSAAAGCTWPPAPTGPGHRS